MAKKPVTRITLIESNASAPVLEKQLAGQKLQRVELWLRRPDESKARPIPRPPRLCGCRRVCLAVVEPDF